MKEVFLFIWSIIWELPQNIIGLIVLLVTIFKKNQYSFENNRLFIKTSFGISLGIFVFWSGTENTKKHEYGHTFQSRSWGWLYLISVGLISFARATYFNFAYKAARKKENSIEEMTKLVKWYYAHYPEDQADIYGGVKRVI